MEHETFSTPLSTSPLTPENSERDIPAQTEQSVATEIPENPVTIASAPIISSPSTMVNVPKMPKPGEKNAPNFSDDKPDELPRFLRIMFDHFTEQNYGDDKRKVELVKYTDQAVEEIWSALPGFANPAVSYEDFVAEIASNYPTVLESGQGSMLRLERKLKKFSDVQPEELSVLFELIRTMKAEIAKLEQMTNKVHTNAQLVGLFLQRLEPEFVKRVGDSLNVKLAATPVPVGGAARPLEDPFTIEEVFTAAATTARQCNNPFYKYSSSTPSSGLHSTTAVKIEEALAGFAGVKDQLNIQLKQQRMLEQQLSKIASQHIVSAPPPQQNYNPPSNQMHNQYPQQQYPRRNYGYSNNANSAAPQGGGGCYYCGDSGHLMRTCPAVGVHMEKGWIRRNLNRIELPNGEGLPRISDGGKTPHEHVEMLNKKGVIPMSKVAQNFFEPAQEPDFEIHYQAPASSSSQDATSYIMNLMAREGPEALQRYLMKTQLNDDSDFDAAQ